MLDDDFDDFFFVWISDQGQDLSVDYDKALEKAGRFNFYRRRSLSQGILFCQGWSAPGTLGWLINLLYLLATAASQGMLTKGQGSV